MTSSIPIVLFWPSHRWLPNLYLPENPNLHFHCPVGFFTVLQTPHRKTFFSKNMITIQRLWYHDIIRNICIFGLHHWFLSQTSKTLGISWVVKMKGASFIIHKNTNKASGVDEFQLSYFKSEKMMLLKCLLMWCITLIDLWILKNPCIPGIKPTWSWCMIFLMCCWILIARILLRIFASMFISDIGL